MSDKKYKAKIKSIDEICQIIGPRPREQKVIMCHGTFDIVHPGHIRHLMYAKGKADILIASLTTDAHIKKANFRPFIPEDIRAVNLAALDMVDYVIIDQDPTPLNHLKRIQPDYFAKGYEYVSEGMPKKTADEKDVLNSYGGEFIFTPGDVVFSSSKFIEMSPPQLGADKLAAFMEAEDLSFDDLRNAVRNCGNAKVHVVGDTIVDSYTQTSMVGGQTKTPTISVRYDGQDDYVGGAGVVAKHLSAAGAEVVFSTVLGADNWKDFVLEDLQEANVRVCAVISETRPTTNKNAIICEQYRLLKIDTLDNSSISDAISTELQEKISSEKVDAVIFSDFRHGIFNPATIPDLIKSIPEGVFQVADSQVASRWGNICDFQNFDLITPNEREARFALGDQDSVIRPLALKLYHAANCKNLILKMGERGLFAYRQIEDVDRNNRSFFIVDTFANHVVDAVGSGDALLAYATLIHVTNGNPVIAAIVGAMAAACECERDGNVPISQEDILNKINWVERKVNYISDEEG